MRRAIPTPRLRVRDLLEEAVAVIAERPGRSILTAVGTVVGTGTLIAVLGLASTTAAQVSSRFDALTATEVHIADARTGNDPADIGSAFPPNADARMDRLNGVRAAGVEWAPREAQQPVHSTPAASDPGVQVPVLAASAGYLAAAQTVIGQGRAFDAFHDRTAQPVAVLGSAAAHQLGVTDLGVQPAIFLDGVPLTVIGIITTAPRAPDLLLSVIVPRGTAERLWGAAGADDQASALIRTDAGAALQVAGEAALALRPDDPNALAITPPPDPRSLREGVDSDLTGLFLALAGICLLVGAVGIAGTTLIAVIERVPEIGLRRSIGATRAHIVLHVLTESTILAALGGLIGTSLGVITVIVSSIPQHWTPVIDPGTVAAGPALGLVTGLAAGIYPAIRAGRVEPVDALRR